MGYEAPRRPIPLDDIIAPGPDIAPVRRCFGAFQSAVSLGNICDKHRPALRRPSSIEIDPVSAKQTAMVRHSGQYRGHAADTAADQIVWKRQRRLLTAAPRDCRKGACSSWRLSGASNPMQTDAHSPDFQACQPSLTTRKHRELSCRNRHGQKQQAEDQGESHNKSVRVWFSGNGRSYANPFWSRQGAWSSREMLNADCCRRGFIRFQRTYVLMDRRCRTKL